MTTDNRFRVQCIPMERWIVISTPRQCGGRFLPGAQRLEDRPEGPTDVLAASCDACGAQREFAFDIEPFFNRQAREHAWVDEVLAGVDEKVRKRIRAKFGPPMPRVLSFIQELANDRDVLGLMFIGALTHAALSGILPRAEDGAVH